jgi:hypothetical protein
MLPLNSLSEVGCLDLRECHRSRKPETSGHTYRPLNLFELPGGPLLAQLRRTAQHSQHPLSGVVISSFVAEMGATAARPLSRPEATYLLLRSSTGDGKIIHESEDPKHPEAPLRRNHRPRGVCESLRYRGYVPLGGDGASFRSVRTR